MSQRTLVLVVVLAIVAAAVPLTLIAAGTVSLSNDSGGTRAVIPAAARDADTPPPAEPSATPAGPVSVPSPDTTFDINDFSTGLHETATRYLTEEGSSVAISNANLPPPGLGDAVVLDEFGTVIRRVTGTLRGGHEYSQLQAFAHDNGYVMLIEGPSEDDSGLVVRRWPSLEVALGDAATADWNVPRWHPVDWSTIVHFDSNADEVLRLQFTDVSTGATETVFTFPSPYERIRGNQSFDEISRTGEWLAGLATTGRGRSSSASIS